MTGAKLLTSRLGDVGLRSCQQDGETIGEVAPGDGGKWWTLLCDSGRKRFTEEVSALRSTCSKVEWRLLVADLAKLLKDAEKGLLIFDTTNTRGEVCRPRGFKSCEDDKTRLDVQEVLELRIERTFNLDERRRHLRLYYSEPSDRACCSICTWRIRRVVLTVWRSRTVRSLRHSGGSTPGGPAGPTVLSSYCHCDHRFSVWPQTPEPLVCR